MLNIIKTLINLLLPLAFLIGLMLASVSIVGFVVSKIRQKKYKGHVLQKIKWLRYFITGLILSLLCAVLYIGLAYLLSPCGDVFNGCGIPEDKGKAIVREKTEVQMLIREHGKNRVHIEALEIELVQHTEFIEQIYPNVAKDTGCIIIAHAGNEGYVYREDKQLNVVYQETLAEFLERTKSIDPTVMSKFYLSLH